jgi:hypothetical protein
MSKISIKKMNLPAKAILAFGPGLNLSTISFFRFLFSNGIGNTWGVLTHRFQDLSTLRPYFSARNILEFGTGSSTLYFLNHGGQSCMLTSYEQDIAYLPKYVFNRPRARAVISEVVLENHQEFAGSRFSDSIEDIDRADFIYVDGPVSPFNVQQGMAGPNLDLMASDSLSRKLIAVDRRHLTVILLIQKLAKTHWFIPTKSFLLDAGRLGFDAGIIENYTPADQQMMKLARTCVFIPRD